MSVLFVGSSPTISSAANALMESGGDVDRAECLAQFKAKNKDRKNPWTLILTEAQLISAIRETLEKQNKLIPLMLIAETLSETLGAADAPRTCGLEQDGRGRRRLRCAMARENARLDASGSNINQTLARPFMLTYHGPSSR